MNYMCDTNTMHQAPIGNALFCESEDSVCGNVIY